MKISSDLLKSLKELSFEAANAIMKVYSQEFISEEKKDGSPITQADLASNKIIIEGLKLLTPTIPVVSEETFNAADTYASQYWLIDPLDGTKGFVNKDGNFAINIALVKMGEPIFGLVQSPVLEKVWTSCDEKPNLTFTLRDKLRIVMSKNHQKEEDLSFLNHLEKKNIPFDLVQKGSSLKFTALCDDDADLYPRFGPTSEWDIAAPHAVLNQYGGLTFSLENQKSLTYAKENILNPPFVAFKNELIYKEFGPIVEEFAKKLL